MEEETMGTKRIRAGWLIDGTGGPVLKEGILEIAGERIVSLSSDLSGKKRPDEGMDFTGCTLLPGLIDCHVHLCMSGTMDRITREEQLIAGFDRAGAVVARHLKQHLRFGIIAVRDGGDRFGHVLQFKKEGRGHGAFSVRIQSAGRAWHAPGRYGGLMGRPPEGGESLAQAIQRDSQGVDCIKIVNSGVNSLVQYGKQTPPQFGARDLAEATAVAHARGLPVMVHANGIQPVRSAVTARVQSVEHGFFMGDENLERMCEAGVTWVPTACAMKAFTDPEVCRNRIMSKDGNGGHSPASMEAKVREVAERTLAHQLDQIRRAKELGVRIALGTDSGSIGVDHGISMVDEIALLIRSGFSIPEVVHCAAEAGARLLGYERLGSLTPGKEATFMVVPGPPKSLPESLRRRVALFLKGKKHLMGSA